MHHVWLQVVYQLDLGSGDPQSAAAPVTFAANEWPTKSRRDKNFVFFADDALLKKLGGTWAMGITLIQPHRVYRVDVRTGRMHHVATTHTDLGFRDHVGLSGGPVRLDNGQLLVAAHVRRGPFLHLVDAARATFFYVCDGKPPFRIRKVTPIVNFGCVRVGAIEPARTTRSEHQVYPPSAYRILDSALIVGSWSRNLEYCNGIERDGETLYVSLGVADCGSVLVQVQLRVILALLRPV